MVGVVTVVVVSGRDVDVVDVDVDVPVDVDVDVPVDVPVDEGLVGVLWEVSAGRRSSGFRVLCGLRMT